MKKLGARKVSNAFVHLRKIAQHPLLVRRLFDDGRLQQMAQIARRKCAHSCSALPAKAASLCNLPDCCSQPGSSVMQAGLSPCLPPAPQRQSLPAHRWFKVLPRHG